MRKLFAVSMKSCLLLLFMMLWTMSANAIPAKPGLTKQLTLNDGTTVTARLVGDEFGHYWMGTDGKSYQLDATTGFYSVIDAETVVASASAKRARSNARRQSRMAPRRVGEVGSYTGQKKGIIILVNFSDVSFNSDNNQALYERIANEKDFSHGSFVGSMYDYFNDQSNGQFELTFDVVGPVTVSQTQAYYGANDSDGDDLHPAEMVGEAIQLADALVDYADYDWDGDGYVDQVYVVYAGKGEADGGGEDTIWPHEYDLYSANYYGDGPGRLRLDDKWINTYACGAELNGQTGSIAGIGTMCHEFSHCLGYPDFYDTDYSGGQGMGYWDLMDSGSYNGDSFCPAGYTSYERWVAGWMEPIELNSNTIVENMNSLQGGGGSYIIYNDGNSNEYFLLENRQKVGWDAALPGAGLLILHADYDATVWKNNKPNDDPSHQRMTWIAADNEYQFITYKNTRYYTEEGMATDPFPYGSVNVFGPNTTPAATLYNQNSDGTYLLNYTVKDITQNSDGTISFNFKSPKVTMTFSATSLEADFGDSFNEPVLTVNPSGLTVTYASSNENVATVDAMTGEVALIGIGMTTITASFAGNDDYLAASASYTLNVVDPNMVSTGKYQLITSTEELEAGKNYLLVYTAGSVAYNGYDNGWGTKGSVTISDNVINLNDGSSSAKVLVLEKSVNDKWQIRDGNNYLAHTESKNSLSTQASATSTGTEWNISFDGTTAHIQNILTNYYLQYNKNNGFRCYTGTQKHPSLYKEITYNKSLSLANNDEEMEEGSKNTDLISASVDYNMNVTLTDRTLYKDGSWNTLCLPFNLASFDNSPLQDAVVKTLESSAYDGHGTLTLNFTEDNLTSIEAGVPYIVKWNVFKIASKADWEAFAARVNSGETKLNAVLTADITEAVATSVGNELYPYAGTFDGQGHRLTLGISGTSRVGAFGNILDASISSLIVDGEVTVSGKFGGSIVGSTNGNCTLDHCVSEATVRTTGTASSYDATCGGMVGINISGTLNITNCAFYGTLDFSNGSYDNGGFVGWSGGTTNLTNCVFSPEEIIGGDEEGYIRGCKTFVRNYTNATFTNCYYTELLGGVSGGNQGEYTTESGENLQALHGGYPTTSISALAQNVVEPVFKNVTISSTPAQTISTTDGTTNWVDFVGTYSPTMLEKENRTVLYLGSNNTLYYPSANVKVNSFRAYFQLKNGLTAGDPNSSEGIRSMNINFGQDTTTGILELPHDIPSTIDYWFTLDGRRLNDKPSHKGIYIHNGKKVMIR